MAEKTITITNETGLHARPASEFVRAASGCPCNVFIEKDGKKINAKSILGILSLAINKGSEVTIYTEGEDADASCDKLVALVESFVD